MYDGSYDGKGVENDGERGTDVGREEALLRIRGEEGYDINCQ
ncbi:hypothetical protein GCM10025794_27770 [Massilia kyonggiensis]